MKRKLDVTPQARRDVAEILNWYRQNMGARTALKVAQTIQSRLVSLAEGHVSGSDLSHASRYRRAVAKKHVVIFSWVGDTIKVVRVVHGSQDLEAIARDLKEGETP